VRSCACVVIAILLILGCERHLSPVKPFDVDSGHFAVNPREPFERLCLGISVGCLDVSSPGASFGFVMKDGNKLVGVIPAHLCDYETGKLVVQPAPRDFGKPQVVGVVEAVNRANDLAYFILNDVLMTTFDGLEVREDGVCEEGQLAYVYSRNGIKTVKIGKPVRLSTQYGVSISVRIHSQDYEFRNGDCGGAVIGFDRKQLGIVVAGEGTIANMKPAGLIKAIYRGLKAEDLTFGL